LLDQVNDTVCPALLVVSAAGAMSETLELPPICAPGAVPASDQISACIVPVGDPLRYIWAVTRQIDSGVLLLMRCPTNSVRLQASPVCEQVRLPLPAAQAGTEVGVCVGVAVGVLGGVFVAVAVAVWVGVCVTVGVDV
jgi:hypothetical protein